MYSTFGAPYGATGGSNGVQSGSESRMSTLIVPLNGLATMTPVVAVCNRSPLRIVARPARRPRHPPRVNRKRDLRHVGVEKNLRAPSHLRHTDVVKTAGATDMPGAAAGGAGNQTSAGSAIQGAAHGSAHTERGTRGQVARLILELGPSTAATLGGRLGLTPAAIRRHLDNLIAEGMIETRTARTYGNRGRGRPAKLFVITDAGRSAFEHAYDDLATSALRFLERTYGPQAVAEFARQQVAETERRYLPVVAQASDLTARVHALADALSG